MRDIIQVLESMSPTLILKNFMQTTVLWTKIMVNAFIIKVMEEAYAGQYDSHMIADVCCSNQ